MGVLSSGETRIQYQSEFTSLVNLCMTLETCAPSCPALLRISSTFLHQIALMSLNNVDNMETAKSDGKTSNMSVTRAKETSASTVSSLDGSARAAHSGTTSKRAALVSILTLFPTVNTMLSTK